MKNSNVQELYQRNEFVLNTTVNDDDMAIDIQDAIGRDDSLSLVADSIMVTAEGDIITLEGEVYRESERMTAGDIATIFAGDDRVNNYLRVTYLRK